MARWLWLTTATLAATLSAIVVHGALPAPSSTSPEWVRGRALFDGSAPLSARIFGHEMDLPAMATRCSNCHPTLRPASPGVGDDVTERFGPVLDAQHLTQPAPRRGGPASVYDRASFCRLLAEGTDPKFVMIPQTMPRYRITPKDCSALWTYVSSL